MRSCSDSPCGAVPVLTTCAVLDFLDSLDNYSTPAPSQTPTISEPALVGEGPAAPASAEDAQSVLDFLDEITQRSSTPTAAVPKRAAGANPSLSRSGSRTNVLSAVGVSSRLSGESIRSRSSPASDSPVMTAAALPEAVETPPVAAEGGWGWSSVWNATTTIVQQAREVAEEQVKTASSTVSGATGLTGGIGGIGEGLMKALGENEQAKKWGEGVIQYARAAHLDQLGAYTPTSWGLTRSRQARISSRRLCARSPSCSTRLLRPLPSTR